MGNIGKITLIGAGPGDSGLMTLKGLKKLKEADVVLYDRLVGDDIISMIPESAEKIDVGKNAGNHPIPQHEINELLLRKAQRGFNVVRLKGGDPFVFGRGGEELELPAENKIDFEVVPGISSSVAGGTYAGIPVTHRDFTSSVHIITGHARENKGLSIDYESLVKLNGTLVFMMGVSNMRDICDGLINAGMERTVPAAVVENATTFSQRKFVGDIETLYDIAKKNNVVSPSVIIVGKVCSLSDKLDWFSKKPLFGKKVIVTRARTSASVLSEQLKELGCYVLETPCIRIVPLLQNTQNNVELTNAIENIKNYSWLVFTSGTGVDLFFDYLSDINFDIRKLHHIKFAAVGSETKRTIQKRGIFVDYTPEQYNGRELAKGLLSQIQKDEKILIARAKTGSEEILEIFTNNGIDFENIALYDTLYETGQYDNVAEMIANNQIDYVTFTSSSTVEGFVKTFPDIDLKNINGLCIGEQTVETAKKYGIQTIMSEKATISSMIEKLKEALI